MNATAIHSVPVDGAPNLPIERRTLYHWAIATFQRNCIISAGTT